MNPKTTKSQGRHVGTPRLRRTLGLSSLFAIGALGLTACGVAVASSSPTTTKNSTSGSPSATAAATITISNFTYSPQALTVTPGQMVKVLNKDTSTHSVTAQASSNGSAPPFNSGNISPGSSGSFRAPSAAGMYNYTCDIHSFMHGILIVK